MTTSPHSAQRRSAAEQQKLDAALIELCERRITFNQVLGLKVESLAAPPRLRFDMRAELVGHRLSGRLHGGVTSAVLDAAGGTALMVGLADKHPHDSTEHILQRLTKLGTIDLRIDYLRPGIGAFFIATAEVLRLGGRVGSTQMRLVNDAGELIATGAGAYIIS
jgi:uncharacterized protein (TIGR00369 family)